MAGAAVKSDVSVTRLEPAFEKVPAELQALPRWVTWKGAKVPYRADLVNAKASVTDPSTWATFEQARVAYDEGGYSGVGFVLNGDGVVGIDLDKCVDGVPNPAAIGILQRIGCRYIEISPSGRGLRGFGRGPLIAGRRGRLDGVAVELYATGRYLTVTGRVLSPGPLVNLIGFADVAEVLREVDLQKSTEDDRSNPLTSSALFCRFPAHTLPDSEGQRNRSLFSLARFLKGTRPDCSRSELRAVVQEWHAAALPAIGTKDFGVTWADFLNGWDKVRQPYGGTMAAIIHSIDETAPLPPGIDSLGYGRNGYRLVRLCMALQQHHDPDPFFISARQAGEHIGVHFTDASKLLAALVADGVLQLVSRGVGKVASRYRFAWPK